MKCSRAENTPLNFARILNSLVVFHLTCPYLALVMIYAKPRFITGDTNEYQMTKASKKSIELETAYVYRTSMPQRHHYSG